MERILKFFFEGWDKFFAPFLMLLCLIFSIKSPAKLLKLSAIFEASSWLLSLTLWNSENFYLVRYLLHTSILSKTYLFFSFSLSSIQDVCIILAIIVVFLLFFNTYIFQAGLVSLLIRKFKTTIIIAVVYLALSVGLHVWTMVSKIHEHIKSLE